MGSGEDGDDGSGDLFARWEQHRSDGSSDADAAPRPAPRHARPVTPEPRTPAAPPAPTSDAPLDSVTAGRDVMAALGIEVPHRDDTLDALEPVDDPTFDEPAEPEHHAPQPPTLGPSTDVVFKPKVAIRRLLSLISFGVFAAACYAGYLVYDDHTQTRVGVLIGLGLLTLFLWAIIITSPVTYLAIRGGQLEVRRGALRQVFDLHSRYTPVQVVGTPGRAGWKVLLGRLDHPPLVIDGGMVNGKQFGAALEHFRPTTPPNPPAPPE